MAVNKKRLIGDVSTGHLYDSTRYNEDRYPYKKKDPELVDSYEKAVEKNELLLADKIIDLKNDLTTIWGKLDDVVNNKFDLFRVQDVYFVNKDEWMEFQAESSELDPENIENPVNVFHTMDQMEMQVKKYYPKSELKYSGHLQSELSELNQALSIISHIMSHLDVALVTDSVKTTDQENDAPF
jgi:hypothetical protein